MRTYLDLAGQAQLTADLLAIHRQTLLLHLHLHLALTLAPHRARYADTRLH